MSRQAPPLALRGIVKRYAATTALDGLDLEALPGRVTGLLGPNGAGKSTALRILVGLVRPDAGEAVIGELPYRRLAQPMRTVGAMLDPDTLEPGISGRGHLRIYAALAGLPRPAVDEVIERFGLARYVDRPAGGWSTGMRQRLALATALLGDPVAIILDEPTNGLDPDGIHELREAMRAWADAGRTVLVSSHVITELEPILDDVAIIREGRTAVAGSRAEVLRATGAESLEDAYRATAGLTGTAVAA